MNHLLPIIKKGIWKLYQVLTKGKIISDSEKKKLIDSYQNPESDFDRVYWNYQISVKGQDLRRVFLLNLLGIVGGALLIPVFCLNRVFFCFERNHDKYEAIFINSKNREGVKYNYEGRIPETIYSDYKSIKELNLERFPRFSEGVLDLKSSILWLNFIIRHPFSGYINFRCLINIMAFNRLIMKYSPKGIINSRAELNSTSSMVTLLCETKGIEYINFMHGEVMTSAATAFVRFTKFYIWDEYYKKIFEWSRCPLDQFIVYKPGIYNIPLSNNKQPDYYATYVFCGDETTHIDKNAEAVKEILKTIVENGKKCKVRPHPRWSDLQSIKELYKESGIEIENPKEISPRDSIENSEIIVGTFSSILMEAYYLGKPVVFDDMSDKMLMDTLEEKMYILLGKPHQLLSELITSEKHGENENA